MEPSIPDDDEADSREMDIIIDGPSDPLPPTIEELKRRKPRKRVGGLRRWAEGDEDDSFDLSIDS